MEDKTLYLKEAQQGQQEAIRWLVEFYQQRVFRYILRMVRNGHDAEDLTQETLLQMCRKLHQVRSPEALNSWVYRIAYRHVLKYSRKTSGDRWISIDDTDIILTADEGNEFTSQDKFYALDILEGLKKREKTLLYLRVSEEMHFSDIALILDISESTARKRYERTRQKLRQRLEAREVNYVDRY